jgi:hypothetical protein
MCTDEEITYRTLVTLANFKGQNPKLLRANHKLKNDLGWDDIGLAFLAMNLRSLILFCSGIGSIYSAELRKKDFNVISLIILMVKRTLGSEVNDTQAKRLIETSQSRMP